MVDRLRGLHVEDAIDTYLVLRAVLRPRHCTLRSAVNRTQFLSEISRPLDFVIFDGQIPGWDTADYLRDIRAYCKVPFFVYSGSGPTELEPFYHIGAEGVHRKADGFESLRDCICTHFGIGLKPPGKRSDLGHSSGM